MSNGPKEGEWDTNNDPKPKKEAGDKWAPGDADVTLPSGVHGDEPPPKDSRDESVQLVYPDQWPSEEVKVSVLERVRRGLCSPN